MKHTIDPVYESDSEILILGSFPSVKSRENNFYYGHPQNRFWKVVSRIFEENEPQSNDEKRKLLLRNNIALWDVIESCDITGSSDSSIRNVKPNDISRILEAADIKHIFVNGKKAEQLYKKYIQPEIMREAICLPSTSPANAAWNIEKLVAAWSVIR